MAHITLIEIKLETSCKHRESHNMCELYLTKVGSTQQGLSRCQCHTNDNMSVSLYKMLGHLFYFIFDKIAYFLSHGDAFAVGILTL